jgi:hypothetical protein
MDTTKIQLIKLNEKGSNYLEWNYQMKMYLRSKNLRKIVLSPSPIATAPTAELNHEEYRRGRGN